MDGIKKKVKEKIKKYSKEEYLNGYIKNEFLTDDGRADILLNIDKEEDLFDSRTSEPQLAINNSIYEYIDEKSSMLNNDIYLKLCIISGVFNSKDKGKIKHIISEHYAIELYKAQKEYKRYKNKIFALVLSGLFFLTCYAIIALNFSSKFFIEVFGFLFSFTLWEAFETYIYTFNDIKLERESITQKLLMDVEFTNKEN